MEKARQANGGVSINNLKQVTISMGDLVVNWVSLSSWSYLWSSFGIFLLDAHINALSDSQEQN